MWWNISNCSLSMLLLPLNFKYSFKNREKSRFHKIQHTINFLFAFFWSALVMYNLHTKSTNFKHTIQWTLTSGFSCVATTSIMTRNISAVSGSFPPCFCIESLQTSPWSWPTADLLSINTVTGFLPFLEFHIIDMIQYKDFCTWLFYFEIQPWCCMYPVYSFLLLNTISLYGYTTIYYLFTVYGHLDCFQSGATMNICLHIFVRMCFHFPLFNTQKWNCWDIH